MFCQTAINSGENSNYKSKFYRRMLKSQKPARGSYLELQLPDLVVKKSNLSCGKGKRQLSERNPNYHCMALCVYTSRWNLECEGMP